MLYFSWQKWAKLLLLISKNVNFPCYILKYTFLVTEFVELFLISEAFLWKLFVNQFLFLVLLIIVIISEIKVFFCFYLLFVL